jgi:glycosyltransferase involved in cell wall biosynthesis
LTAIFRMMRTLRAEHTSRLRTTIREMLTTAREYIVFDSMSFRVCAALLGLAAGYTLLAVRSGRFALRILSAVHRAGYLVAADRAIEHLFRTSFAGSRFGAPLVQACRAETLKRDTEASTAKFIDNPRALLGPLAMVLRSPNSRHKGVLLLQYNYVFPLFARLFDLDRILTRYHLVLEPSWSGYCTSEVLCYARLASPVFVEAFEPRDRRFVEALDVGFLSVPTSTNWWVDHRVFRPLPCVAKDVDVVMVAGWGSYKRHASFFRALRRLRALHRDIRVVLVGYRLGFTKDDILGLADRFDVADAIQCFENLSQEEVNVQFNRARVNVLWSRKEGVNRAIVEGMFADVPCVVREGFNYGHPYEYINQLTGSFSTEADLPATILRMLERADTFRAREWVMAHMSCQQSTKVLSQAIDAASGEGDELAVKVNGLYGMHYWEASDQNRFTDDYSFLWDVRRAAS